MFVPAATPRSCHRRSATRRRSASSRGCGSHHAGPGNTLSERLRIASCQRRYFVRPVLGGGETAISSA
jgi:hypothetical protein